MYKRQVMIIGCGMIGMGAIVRSTLRGATVIAVDMGYTFVTRPKCMVHRTGRMVMKNCWEKRCSRSATKL